VQQLEALAPPLEAFDKLCGPGSGPLGIAVSGGSDSLALLHLADDWARSRGRSVAAFTFDHRLRDASAVEAARVAGICGDLRIPHETLQWKAPVKGQSAARRARHVGLAEALKAHGGNTLLTGHTADDQFETFLMRARQGSAWYGLAGMQAVSLSPVWPEGEGVRLVRPLLGQRRSDLRQMLKSRGQDWVDDPSNDNPAYERVRVRHLLTASPALADRVSNCLTDMAALRAIEDTRLGIWMRDHVRIASASHVEADFMGLGAESAARAAGLIIQAVTGRELPARGDSLRALAGRFQASRAFAGATLGGASVTRKAGIVHFVPEVGLERPDPLLFQRIGAMRAILIGQP
jgi:tRNA(Ile)-lysidine synthase